MKSLQGMWDRVGTLEAQLAGQAAQLSTQTSQIAAQQARIRSLQLMTGQISGATANCIWQMPQPYPALVCIGSTSMAFDQGGEPVTDLGWTVRLSRTYSIEADGDLLASWKILLEDLHGSDTYQQLVRFEDASTGTRFYRVRVHRPLSAGEEE